MEEQAIRKIVSQIVGEYVLKTENAPTQIKHCPGQNGCMPAKLPKVDGAPAWAGLTLTPQQAAQMDAPAWANVKMQGEVQPKSQAEQESSIESPSQPGKIPVEVSARHVHLTQKDVDALFGAGHQLTPKRELSQPGQFLCEERVTLITGKGEIKNVAVLGPVRKSTQVELSFTDARGLGLAVPVRQSGDTEGGGDVYIFSDKDMVRAPGSVIVAKNHIHMTCKDAQAFGVKDNQSVRVKMNTSRPVTFEDVIVRVSDQFSLAMHIDFDEANACAFQTGNTGSLLL